MGGTPYRTENWAAREEVLSSDLVRGQLLASKMVQDSLRDLSTDANNVPIAAWGRVPIWSPVVGTFNVHLTGYGRANVFSTTGVTADDSDYQVIEVPDPTNLVFTTPDATNPRIDLVVLTPVSVAQDLVARNTLLDPVARTQAMVNVAKTTQPLATAQVIAGTPGVTPAPPAVPANTFAVYEVFIPAAAADSLAFAPVQRMWTRVTFPWTVLSGLVSGLALSWDLTADVSTTSSALVCGGGPNNFVLIDGELVDASSLIPLAVSQDTGANPFGSAPGGGDRPYFIYAVGGRHAPQSTTTLGGFAAIAIVESTVVPNLKTARPTSSITTPRGVAPVNACVYIGIGFVASGTTNRRPCIMTGDMTEIVGADIAGLLGLTKTGAGVEALGTLTSRPSISRKVRGRLGLGAASATAELHMHPDRGDGVAAAPTSIGAGSLQVTPMVKTQVAANVAQANVEFYFNPTNPKIWIGGAGLANGDSIQFVANAYDHRVTKLFTQS